MKPVFEKDTKARETVSEPKTVSFILDWTKDKENKASLYGYQYQELSSAFLGSSVYFLKVHTHYNRGVEASFYTNILKFAILSRTVP